MDVSNKILSDITVYMKYSRYLDKLQRRENWNELVVFSNHSDWVNHVAWHPDGKMVASASRDHTAKVFDISQKKRLSSYTGHDASIYAVQFHPESPDVFSGAGDGRLMRWRIKDSGTVREYVKHAEAVFHLALNPSMKHLTTQSVRP